MIVFPKITESTDGELEAVTFHHSALEEPKATLKNNKDGTFTLVEEVDIFVIDLMFAEILVDGECDCEDNIFRINVNEIEKVEGVNEQMVEALAKKLEQCSEKKEQRKMLEEIWALLDDDPEDEDLEEDLDGELPF